MQTDLEKALQEFDSADGFYVAYFDFKDPETLKNALQLYVGFVVGGEDRELPGSVDGETTVTVKQWVEPTEQDRGECVRDHYLIGAVCRYINTGGKIAELIQLLRTIGTSLSDIDFDFDGRTLSNTYMQDGDYLHLFTKPGDPTAVCWWENNYIELLTMEDEVIDIEPQR